MKAQSAIGSAAAGRIEPTEYNPNGLDRSRWESQEEFVSRCARDAQAEDDRLEQEREQRELEKEAA